MPGETDIYPITRHYGATNEVPLNITNHITGGEKVYATVKCFNGVMLHTTQSSDGVIVVTQPPISESASVTIKTSDVTQFPIHEMYQFESTRIRASWNGFIDPTGIAYYEVNISFTSKLETTGRPRSHIHL